MVLRMSPSRCTDSRAWWKSCHICARRSTGCGDPPGQHVEGDEFADRERALDDQLGAEIKRQRGDQLADQLHRLARRVAEADDAEARRDIAGELLLPAPLHLRLDRHRLQRLDPVDAFDQKGLVLGAAAEFLVEPAAEERRRPGRDRDIEREGAEHDPGQERRVVEHHRQEDEGEEQVDDQRQRRTGQELADVFQFAHPRHRVAGAPRLEIGDRQRHQMAEQPRPKLDIDAVGGVREQIGPQAPEDRLEHADRRSGRSPARRASTSCDAPAPCRSRPGRTAARPARTAAGRTRRSAPRRAGGGICGSRPGTR